MASNVSFKFTGDSSELRAELKKVEKNLDGLAGAVQGTTNKTRKGLDGLTKTVEGTGKTAKTAANNNKAFNSSLAEMQTDAAQTASIMGGLATSITVISPRAGAAVRAVGDLATGVASLSGAGRTAAVVLGPLGVGIAAAGAAFLHFKSNIEKANEALKANRDRLKEVQDISRQVKEATLIAAHAELQSALATGKATQAQVNAAQAKLDDMAIAQQSLDLFGARRDALEKEQQAIKDQIDAQKTQTQERVQASAGMSVMLAAHAAGTQAHKDSTEATAAETTELQRLELQLQNTQEQLGQLDFAQNEYQDALKRTKEAQQAATKSTENDTGKQKEQAGAVKATAAALAMLQSKNEAALVSQLNERQKILHSYQREIESIQEVANQHVGNAEIENAADEAQHNRKVQMMREIDALQKQQSEEAKQRSEEEAEEERKRLGATLAATMSLASATSDVFSLVADKKAETDKKAAIKAFRTAKALAMSEVAVNFAVATMANFRSGNPVVAALQQAAATAAFAASTARIASQKPSFHSGTGLVRAPSGVSEMNARLRGGEAVSTPLGAELIGRSNIERANAGMRPGGGSGGVSFQYEHKVFSQFIRDNIRSRGPLSNEHDRRRHVGHRSA